MFHSSTSFLDAFISSERWTRPVVIFFDEFDVLLDTEAKSALSSLLSTLRSARDSDNSRIHSIVSIGTFAITLLDQTDVNLSPFNAAENFASTSLTAAQVKELFNEFANDRRIYIDSGVIDDIYQLTNGHAGMVNVCGAAIDNDFVPSEGRTLGFDRWQGFAHSMLRNVLAYPTFHRMENSLMGQKEAVDFLRLNFLGNFDKYIGPSGKENLANFLSTLGVLSPSPDGLEYRISSPMIDLLICQRVIPALYPMVPLTRIPKRYEGGPLDLYAILKMVLKIFDGNLIERAAGSSYKTATVKVGGHTKVNVPRESIYDSELLRILSNWFQQERFKVIGQWHHVVDNNHRYSDIIIEDDDRTPRIVLELLATGTPGTVNEHITRVKDYKNNLGATEAWVIHFTREDNYFDHPEWQSDELLRENINVVHIWHNLDFTEVKMMTRWYGSALIKMESIIEGA